MLLSLYLKCLFVYVAPGIALRVAISFTCLDPEYTYCNATFDEFLCWPPVKAGELSIRGCPKSSVTDPEKNASRQCYENGTWSQVSYANCLTKSTGTTESLEKQDDIGVRIVYNVGFSVTIVALVIALSIFIYFKSLRCLRNTIHCHLIVSFLLQSGSWLLLHNFYKDIYDFSKEEWVCRLTTTLYHYFHSVPFYWMFVEGLYLYTIVVWAFSLQRIRFWHYVCIGWGIPVMFPVVWAIVKAKIDNYGCWLTLTTSYNYDFIVEIPVLIILACNTFFIIAIVWVLVTKLRASNSLETRQSRKAVRAIAVLVPLLGIIFIFFLTVPESNVKVANAFKYVNAVMQSLQGFFVAIIYCFMNGEVQAVMKKKFSSYRDNRALTRFTKSSIFSSPHRSSCYAMPLQSNGKSSHSIHRTSNGSGHSRLSQTVDQDTEACASMMENVL